MPGKVTLVLGASANPARYSFMAISRLRAYGHPVIAIGKKNGEVAGVKIKTAPGAHPIEPENIDTVTLYLNPGNQKAYYDYILSLRPKRIIFNPGTENEELSALAKDRGIESLEACTLVMLSAGCY